MNVISGVVLVFILVCAGLECYSFISESIYETSTLNFGIFIRCSINNTCTIWNFDLFKNDLVWLQTCAILSITTTCLLLLLILVLILSFCIDDCVRIRCIIGFVSFVNVLVLSALIGIFTLKYRFGIEDDLRDIYPNINDGFDNLKLGLSYWLLVGALGVNVIATITEFTFLPHQYKHQ